MLRDGTVKADGVWKRFRADRSRRLVRDVVERLRNKMASLDENAWRWALKDIHLDVEPGESIGMVGVNGSGKSTLLKILTGVMYPFAGEIEVVGRVGALIDVRAGIHPDLTGRENVFLYGALMGLRRHDVASRFDQIVSFAELEDSIDRQVKYYSSGMQMRLGFAGAAFLEPNILLVDEVLAVGDAAFQQKCLDRMGVILSEGTTLILVSHDLTAIEATCERAVWIDEGEIRANDDVRSVLSTYRMHIEEQAHIEGGQESVGITNFSVQGPDGGPAQTGESLVITGDVHADTARVADVVLGVSEGPAPPMFVVRQRLHLSAGITRLSCEISRSPLPRGRFFVWTGVYDVDDRPLHNWRPQGHFDVVGPDLAHPPRAVARLSPIHVDARWSVQ